MKRDPFLVSRTIIGTYTLKVLIDPFGAFYYEQIDIDKVFKTEQEAIDHYYEMQEDSLLRKKNVRLNQESV
jgi:hypothetical protein